MTIKLAAQLKERLDRNMRDFKADLLDYDSESIINMAHTIAAMDDTYRLMTTAYEFDDGEAEYLLKFANPLEIIADEWSSFLGEFGSDFDTVLYNFFDRDDNEDIYLLESNTDNVDIDFEEFDFEDKVENASGVDVSELAVKFLDAAIAFFKVALDEETKLQ